MAKFDKKELVTKAHFGHIGLPFPSWFGNNKTLSVLPNLKNIGSELRDGSSPYFMQVTLIYNSENFTLPNEPLVSLAQSKTIIQTATVGIKKKGTVKEYITTGDYQIVIRGICYEEDMESYPSEQVAMLNQLANIDGALEVAPNKFFEFFQIRRIVIKDIQFDEMEGQQGMQRYVITAVSDQDFYADLSNRI